MPNISVWNGSGHFSYDGSQRTTKTNKCPMHHHNIKESPEEKGKFFVLYYTYFGGYILKYITFCKMGISNIILGVFSINNRLKSVFMFAFDCIDGYGG